MKKIAILSLLSLATLLSGCHHSSVSSYPASDAAHYQSGHSSKLSGNH